MTGKSNIIKLRERKDSVKNNKYYRKYVDRHPTISNFITAIYCKGCGTQIMGLNSDDILIPYWNYRIITIEFDNNSTHMTPVCAKCMKTKNMDNLEAMYIADLEDFEHDDSVKESKTWDIYLDRIPRKIAGKSKRS
jgi:hypothetical protein